MEKRGRGIENLGKKIKITKMREGYKYEVVKKCFNVATGVYIFHFAPSPQGEGGKIWVFGRLGKKYDDLLSKRRI